MLILVISFFGFLADLPWGTYFVATETTELFWDDFADFSGTKGNFSIQPFFLSFLAAFVSAYFHVNVKLICHAHSATRADFIMGLIFKLLGR